MSQGQPAFPPRNAFASSTKLPDRTFNNTATQPTFAQSAYARRPEQSYASSSHAAPPPQHVFAPGPGRESMERDSNFLAELSVEQRDECNEAFQLFDLDRDNYITYHELRVALRALGFKVPKSELKDVLRAHGLPTPGAVKTQDAAHFHVSQLQISQAAFIRVAARKMLDRDPTVEVERAYNLFDLDRKGYIVMEDLRRVSRDLGENGLEDEELHAMVEEYDYDGTNTVAKEAFYAICLQ